MRLKIIESLDSFRMLRENQAYYVDKTPMLKEYLTDNFKSAVLFTRPRRFGKTVTMTMFRDFLDIRQDSRDIFSGLKIMEHGRSDLVVFDPARRRCLILELKHVKKESSMASALREAQSQIIKKKYESRLLYEGCTQILRYGLSFWGKSAMVASV